MVKRITRVGAAAAFHDSRRQDDWYDAGHGQRAAEYYYDLLCQIFKDIDAFDRFRLGDINIFQRKDGKKYDFL